MVLSREAREYRTKVMWEADLQVERTPFVGKVKVRADIFMDLRGDLDNRTKQMLDAIRGIAFEDDKQVWELHLVRHLDRHHQRVEIEISEAA